MAELYQSRYKGYEIDNILSSAEPINNGGLSANKIVMPNNELLPTYMAGTMASKDYVQEEIEKSKSIIQKARLSIHLNYIEDTDDSIPNYANKIEIINEAYEQIDSKTIHDDVEYVIEVDGGHKYIIKLYVWTSSASWNLIETQEIIVYGGDYKEVYLNDFDVTTWRGIKAIVNAGKTAEYFQVGDTIAIDVISPERINFVVVGISVYEEHELTLMTRDCLSNIINPYDSKSASSHTWQDSNIQHYLNDELLYQLPQDLQKIIAVKENYVWVNNQNADRTDYYVTKDKLWLASYKEVMGIRQGTTGRVAGFEYLGIWNLDKPFPYYVSAAGCIKRIGGTNTTWWLRSAPTGSNSASSKENIMDSINASGAIGQTGTGSNAGISFCFCVRKDKGGN